MSPQLHCEIGRGDRFLGVINIGFIKTRVVCWITYGGDADSGARMWKGIDEGMKKPD